MLVDVFSLGLSLIVFSYIGYCACNSGFCFKMYSKNTEILICILFTSGLSTWRVLCCLC